MTTKHEQYWEGLRKQLLRWQQGSWHTDIPDKEHWEIRKKTIQAVLDYMNYIEQDTPKDRQTRVQVGILMGSDSDWDKVKGCAKALDEFGVEYEVNVMSAHRTPGTVAEYAKMAAHNGLQVIICAAGGAAHLAGVVAANTILPVIGIPVQTEFAGGLDSLLSTVQMPGDIPVATVGANSGGARNAGILAVQILALSNNELKEKLREFRKGLVDKMWGKNQVLNKKIREANESNKPA
jgi:5-(carboxyamino)imidazole ribonucleotide mutase